MAGVGDERQRTREPAPAASTTMKTAISQNVARMAAFVGRARFVIRMGMGVRMSVAHGLAPAPNAMSRA